MTMTTSCSVNFALCEDADKQLSATNKFKGERQDVGVVKAGEEVDLCPDAGFVSLYIFLLDDFEGNMTGWMDEPDGVLVESQRDSETQRLSSFDPYEMTNQDINATYNTHRFFLTPSLMVAPCREFANIPISKSHNPCYEPSNQYTNQHQLVEGG